MEIVLSRFMDNGEGTLGNLWIDKVPQCFTLENTYNFPKVFGNTRIPSGRYQVKLRTTGGMTDKYTTKFGKDFHKGMLWLQDVPNFEWVYLHIGNKSSHTDGCILVGLSATSDMTNTVGKSTTAYKKVYKLIADAVDNGDQVYITILDETIKV